MPTITEERLRGYSALVCIHKEMYVRDHRGPADPPLSLTVVLDDDQVWSGTATEDTYKALSAEALNIGSLILMSVLKLAAELGLKHHVKRVIVSSDAHARVAQDREELNFEEYRHGDFQRDFESNPASLVKEAMVTWCAERSESGDVVLSTAYVPYKYGDQGEVVWDETTVIMWNVLSLDDPTNVGPAMVQLFNSLGVNT